MSLRSSSLRFHHIRECHLVWFANCFDSLVLSLSIWCAVGFQEAQHPIRCDSMIESNLPHNSSRQGGAQSNHTKPHLTIAHITITNPPPPNQSLYLFPLFTAIPFRTIKRSLIDHLAPEGQLFFYRVRRSRWRWPQNAIKVSVCIGGTIVIFTMSIYYKLSFKAMEM